MIPRERKRPKNTRRARGRRTNRERPAAPYRTGGTATVRVIPPSGEAARTYAYATTPETRPWQRFGFRASTPAAMAPAEPGNGPGHALGTGPATAERGAP